ncbi:hypothetical protein NBRC116188_05590 [Oceaniserpentilla sp. 4NH20-0058]|uniref:hypothetical protein n=1 Tax=Oceaniserpentilla sp. 4NH20-0058 TaxID=3127660 RepID=UPI003106B13D
MDIQSLQLIPENKRPDGKGIIYRPFKTYQYSGVKGAVLRLGISTFKYFGFVHSLLINTLLFIRSIPGKKHNVNKNQVFAFHSNDHGKSHLLIEGALKDVDMHMSTSRSTASLSVDQTLSLVEKVKAYFLTIAFLVSCLLFPRKLSRGVMLVNSVDAYTLICFYKSLMKLGGSNAKLIMTNHYDRWVYVASQQRLLNGLELSIVQHGFLNQYYKLPNICGTLSNLYIMDQKFKPQFERYFSAIANTKVFKSQLDFVELTKGRSILLISSGQTIDEEQEVLKKLSSLVSDDVLLIYKRHPLYKYPQIKLKNLVFFEEPKGVPLADVVICGESFLGYEYASNGMVVSPLKEYEEVINRLKLNG